jgi:adenylate kinase family enzyme
LNRIVVIGPPGAGKSTVALRLGKLLGIDVFHLDELYWQRGAPPRPEEWVALESELIARERWILDGNYSRTLPARLEAADAVVFLDFSTARCLFRFVRRRLAHRTGSIPGMAADRRPYVNVGVLRQIATFRTDHRPSILQALSALSKGRRIVILRTPRSVRRFLLDVQVEQRASR